MIIVLFPAGAFGSTVEYCLREFSCELTKIAATVLDDGSMHSFNKQFHTVRMDEFLRGPACYEIATPLYPGLDYLGPVQTIQKFQQHISVDQKVVMIYFNDLMTAQRNQLFCYYKIPTFFDDIIENKYLTWNPAYTSWKDMQRHELRELLSFHVDQLSRYLGIQQQVNQDWLLVTPDDLLYNFKGTLLRILDYLQLTPDNQHRLDAFYDVWFSKQTYILDEFDLINQIMHEFVAKSDFAWHKLSIMGEAIVQSRLRNMGLEIACDQLNQFPMSVSELHKIIL